MVALLANVLSWLSAAFLRQSSHLQASHPSHIPLPSIVHKVLDEQFLRQFDEVLIVGDVHGCYDEMIELIQKAHERSQGSKLLKLFAGDLVNKGPKSREVIQYMMQQGREDSLSVRGNHEEFIIKQYLNWRDNPSSLSEQNQWVSLLSEDEVEYLISLPYTISLPSLNSVIVHAGLIPGKPLDQNTLFDMVNMRNLIYKDYFDGGIQATKLDTEGEPWAPAWRGPQFVYFGHDAKRKLQINEYCIGLDTGCLYGGKLTGIFIKKLKNEYIEVPAKKVYKMVPKTEL